MNQLITFIMVGKGGYVYIVSNKHRTVFYIGVTSNLYKRTFEHKSGFGSSFTTKYNCIDLIYHSYFDSIVEAINHEKRMKKWKRKWKEELVKEMNPKMVDLFDEVSEL